MLESQSEILNLLEGILEAPSEFQAVERLKKFLEFNSKKIARGPTSSSRRQSTCELFPVDYRGNGRIVGLLVVIYW